MDTRVNESPRGAGRKSSKRGAEEGKAAISAIVRFIPASAAKQEEPHEQEWWRPIPETPTTDSYVTGVTALNIPHEGRWAGWHGLMWHLRIEGESEEIKRANQARMGRADEWPYWDETSLRDAREGLEAIGHPSAGRSRAIYAATFARVVAEWVVKMALARGEALAYPQPREVRAWLSRNEQREELANLLASAARAQTQIKEEIHSWRERTGI